MATKRSSQATTSRLNVMLSLTRSSERRAFEALSAADFRTPGQMATRIVLAQLAQRTTNLPVRPIPPGARIARSLPIRLTPAQLRKLKSQAAMDGRTLSNYVTILVIGALRR